MIIEIKNITDEELDLFNDGSVLISVDDKIVVFDNSDTTTYDTGYRIIRIETQNISSMIESSIIEVFVEYNIVSKNKFESMVSNFNVKTFFKTNIAFDNIYGENMFFSLDSNKLKIYNPISGKTYSVQLTEDIE